MFNNASSFNLQPFNRVFTANVYGSFMIESTGNITVIGNLVASPSFEIEGGSELTFQSVAERLAKFTLESIGELKFNGFRERFGSFELEAKGELVFAAGRFRVEILEFTGEFKPGDRIVIDAKMLTLTKNGQNALQDLQGDFFELNLGTNSIEYTDDQTVRTVRMRITHRDKFV